MRDHGQPPPEATDLDVEIGNMNESANASGSLASGQYQQAIRSERNGTYVSARERPLFNFNFACLPDYSSTTNALLPSRSHRLSFHPYSLTSY
jgi:hypothetical protein